MPGPARGQLDINAPVADNLKALARALDRDVDDLVVIVLDRPRHEQLIADIRKAGARIRLIGDGDLSAGISAAVSGTGVHAVMGTGGAPEGVLTAAAMRCLNGEIQGRLVMTRPSDADRMRKMGIADLDRVYRTEDLAPGKGIIFAAAGVTEGAAAEGRPLLPRRHPHRVPGHDHRAPPGPLHRHDPRRRQPRRRHPVLTPRGPGGARMPPLSSVQAVTFVSVVSVVRVPPALASAIGVRGGDERPTCC